MYTIFKSIKGDIHTYIYIYIYINCMIVSGI